MASQGGIALERKWHNMQPCYSTAGFPITGPDENALQISQKVGKKHYPCTTWGNNQGR